MAKLPRVTTKIFASNAAANDIGQYGSALAGNKLATGDIAQIQALPAFLTGWRAAVLSTRNYPTLQEMNGLQKVFSQQIAYLFEHGVAEYDAASVYYAGDIIKVVTNGVPALKYSVIDNNLGNSVDNTSYWADLPANVPIASVNTPGIVQPDGQTITITDGIISANAGANTDLSNLTSNGNAKFQYAPFSINSGSVDASGNNNTLQLPGGAEVTTQWIQPVLSANGTMGGNSFAVNSNVIQYQSSINEAYLAFNGSKTGGVFHSTQGVLSGYIDFYNPQALCVKKLTITNQESTANRASKAGIIYGSNDGSNWTQIKSYTNSVQTAGASWNIDLSDNTNFYKYYRMESSGTPYSGTSTAPYAFWVIAEIEIDALYTASASNSLVCAPCTLTTADGRTKTFENNSILNISGLSNGTYKILKAYTDGSLSAVSSLSISKTAPSSPSSGALWLDNSMYPLSLKQYNGSAWAVNNDLVYIGDVTISSGAITAVKNREFNKKIETLGVIYSEMTAKTVNTVYTAEQAGILLIGTFHSGTALNAYLYINNTLICQWEENIGSYNWQQNMCIPINEGDTYKLQVTAGSGTLKFAPMKGY